MSTVATSVEYLFWSALDENRDALGSEFEIVDDADRIPESSITSDAFRAKVALMYLDKCLAPAMRAEYRRHICGRSRKPVGRDALVDLAPAEMREHYYFPLVAARSIKAFINDLEDAITEVPAIVAMVNRVVADAEEFIQEIESS